MPGKRHVRKLYIHGDISVESFSVFSKQLAILERESFLPIDIEIITCGGEAHAALAFSDRMVNSPCELIITGYGCVDSAGVLILASGSTRKLGQLASCLVHEDSDSLTGDVKELERATKHMRYLEDQWAQRLEELTGTSAWNWTNMHKATKHLTAQECLKYGLIDEILGGGNI